MNKERAKELCKTISFREFARVVRGGDISTESDAVRYLLQSLGIESFDELSTNVVAQEVLTSIENQHQTWLKE